MIVWLALRMVSFFWFTQVAPPSLLNSILLVAGSSVVRVTSKEVSVMLFTVTLPTMDGAMVSSVPCVLLAALGTRP